MGHFSQRKAVAAPYTGLAEGSPLFDRIIFFEALHHAFDHRAVLDRLRDHLSEDGFVLFAGEPIVKRGHYQGIPFPWGPRLDGLSIWSTHTHGWCELGFQEEYFTEMLWRAGWLVRAEPFPFSGRGHCCMAKPMRGAMVRKGRTAGPMARLFARSPLSRAAWSGGQKSAT